MADEMSNMACDHRRNEAIGRRELIRTIPKGPIRREAKRMNELIATMDRLLSEHGSK